MKPPIKFQEMNVVECYTNYWKKLLNASYATTLSATIFSSKVSTHVLKCYYQKPILQLQDNFTVQV